ncbi:MAG TPA: serine/threonine-protein kinase [Sandaracinaceae bacterium LLY-WYZ-13_1]|nr:serine/threonine-protein kinase [Sandaracinaceae bacterium LLY-WYZ-13_1]
MRRYRTHAYIEKKATEARADADPVRLVDAVGTLAALDPVAKIGRYDIVGRLASGGMAEIFLARESGPHTVGRHLVIKRILPHVADDERMVDMFVHEARVCMNLSHPHICPIYEFGEEGGSFFLAMEWVRGVSLRDLIDRVGGPLPVPFVTKVFADIAGALHHAHTCTDPEGHALSIVHRDVNPENLMIGFDGVTKLLDFGVAAAATERKHKTEAGNLKGKFAYISPEQYQGQPLDGRSDVFSLGVSLYEALTGRSLYDRASEYETVAAIVLDPDVPSIRTTNPDVPPELDVIVQMALSKNRDERYSSADEMQAALLTFAAREGHHVRHADIAATLRELVPDVVDAEPKLDRRPPTVQRRTEAAEPAPEPARSPDQEMQAMLLAAEADEDAEELLGARKRGGKMLGLLSALIILASLAVIGWAVTRPRDDGDATGAEEPAAQEAAAREPATSQPAE